MIDLMQTIELTWNKTNKKYYVGKGYKHTKTGDKFFVYAKDLPIGSHEKVKVCCDICQSERFIPLVSYNNNAQRNNGRYVCHPCSSSVSHSKTLDKRRKDYIARVLNKCSECGYELLSTEDEIHNNASYIRYKCPIHGEQSMRIGNFLSGRRCPHCNHDARSADYRLKCEDVMKRVQDCGGEILNPEDYKNRSKTNLRFKCPNCGSVFTSSLHRFIQHGGQLCRDCSRVESVGELKIKQYLNNQNIHFEREYWFDDCRDIHPLPFDFYLKDSNTIIEFDGRQHFEETNHFSYPLGKVLAHDIIKNQYCVQKGIKLIRIPYTKVNHIEEILGNQLFT